MTDEELKALVASLAASSQETWAMLQATRAVVQENALLQKETDRQMKETGRRLDQLGVQIGGIGNKFGSFTEGLVAPGLRQILVQHFGCDSTMGPTFRKNPALGLQGEYDMLGAANGSQNRVVMCEVKSLMRPEDLAQVERQAAEFGKLFPEYKGLTLEVVVAAVSASEELERAILKRGFHLAKMSGDMLQLADPPGFRPRRVLLE